jgi:hypothetical protein
MKIGLGQVEMRELPTLKSKTGRKSGHAFAGKFSEFRKLFHTENSRCGNEVGRARRSMHVAANSAMRFDRRQD